MAWTLLHIHRNQNAVQFLNATVCFAILGTMFQETLLFAPLLHIIVLDFVCRRVCDICQFSHQVRAHDVDAAWGSSIRTLIVVCFLQFRLVSLQGNESETSVVKTAISPEVVSQRHPLLHH